MEKYQVRSDFARATVSLFFCQPCQGFNDEDQTTVASHGLMRSEDLYPTVKLYLRVRIYYLRRWSQRVWDMVPTLSGIANPKVIETAKMICALETGVDTTNTSWEIAMPRKGSRYIFPYASERRERNGEGPSRVA